MQCTLVLYKTLQITFLRFLCEEGISFYKIWMYLGNYIENKFQIYYTYKSTYEELIETFSISIMPVDHSLQTSCYFTNFFKPQICVLYES